MAAPRLEHTYPAAVPDLSVPWRAAEVAEPELLVLNEPLAAELGLDPAWLRTPEGVAFLTGQGVPDTAAQAYAGHQFGHYSPRLGDGRALLLGELVDPAGRRHDLHLKGSGRTPFSRGGDGLAAVGPMLREHLIGEFLHAVGIPTTRSLAVVATQTPVRRERLLPGAVLCRVAASHLRVGTFQYAAALGDPATSRALLDHAITRHHPEAGDASDPALALLDAVATAQAELVARWQLIGFVHGVMNTDNMTISGESIDFGPCAFLESYDPSAVFSSIDHQGRYAYGNQPAAAQWNLARLAEALLPLMVSEGDAAVEQAVAVLHAFAERFDDAYARGLAAKLGLATPDPELQRDLHALLRDHGPDWTSFFRALGDGTARDLFGDPAPFEAWARRWEAARPDRAAMARTNPVVVPRNWPVQDALDAASDGDLGPFRDALAAVTEPYADPAGRELLIPGDGPFVTYCGT